MKKSILFLAVLLCGQLTFGQISAKLMRYMDVSDSQITFVYGGDIWTCPKDGGTALQLTHSPGEESWPRFSPDGSSIAYTASYNGNQDVYVMPARGGVPIRLTYHSFSDRMVEWHPDGERILFASGRESGRQSYSQFYLVNKKGGMPEKLNVPYGELASFAPDGNALAYITKITENYPFKRYRGGLTSDILVCDLTNERIENITNNHATDGKPAWVGDQIFFLSDQGEQMRLNVWVYDTKQKKASQLTFLKDFDISFLSAGSDELVFEAGGSLYLMDATSKEYNPVEINVVSDLSLEIPRSVNVSKRIRNVSASPEGKRIVFEARGELFNVPVKEGYVINMTRSSGAFDMLPSWSPDGSQVAYWSDASGEYQIYLQGKLGEPPVQLTNRSRGFGYRLYWSPDSKKLSFIDETNDISVIDLESKSTTVIAKSQWNLGHGSRYNYPIAWSPDSKWLAFSLGLDNVNSAIFLYSMEDATLHQVTSGFFDDAQPTFSEDGKYLYYLTDRNMSATYSDMGDGTWVYPNATQLAAIPLSTDTPSLLNPKNDELKKKDDSSDKKENEEDAEKDSKKNSKKDSEKDDDNAEKEEPKVEVKIDLNEMEARMDILPPKAGNLSRLASFKGKVVFLRSPNTGSESRSRSLVYYDLEEREEKTILKDVNQVSLTADGKMLLVNVKGS